MGLYFVLVELPWGHEVAAAARADPAVDPALSVEDELAV
jgi:hypothetical protein